MEDVAYTRSSLHLDGTFFNEPALKLIRVCVDELINQDQHQLAAIDVHQRVSSNHSYAGSPELILLVEQSRLDLSVKRRNRLFDVVEQNRIEGLGEERDSELLGVDSIDWVLAEILLLTTDRLLDRNLVNNLLLGSAFHSIVA